MDFGFTAVPSITAICYLVAMGIKASQKCDEWIPVICGIIGGILGVAAFFIIPDYSAKDYITAFAIGLISGFAATGVNQIFKQLKK